MGLTPPPVEREPGAPVLLRVHLGVLELPLLATDRRGAGRATAQQVGVPVLAEERHGGEHSATTEGARPRHGARERQLRACLRTEVDPDIGRGGGEGAVAGRDREPVR